MLARIIEERKLMMQKEERRDKECEVLQASRGVGSRTQMED